MKKAIQIEATFCDQCGKQDYVQKCLGCGIEHCWECAKTHGVEYQYSLYCSGSGAGYYCNVCNEKFLRNGDNNLHTAYLKIYNLRNEEKLFNTGFQTRAKNAEGVLKKLQNV